MTPPIKVMVKTDNLRMCEVRFEGAGRDEDGNPSEVHTIEVPSAGNVYQGLHSARPALEAYVNELLAAHGIHPAADPEVEVLEEHGDTEPETDRNPAPAEPPPVAAAPAAPEHINPAAPPTGTAAAPTAPTPALAVIPAPATPATTEEPAAAATPEQTVKLGT